ncbi:MAG: M50 family metallopeptidase, partial [Chloroflexi bacterium]|nr:M50 family metallopeptidase [Chloroflexota bacterium]
MRASVKLFTVRGIPVDINASWLIAFAIVTWSFSTVAFPTFFHFWSVQQYWLAGTASAVLLFASVLAHELGHSFVAMSQGLRVRGITLLLFGGVSRIEGDATRPRNEFFIAFAGPTVSLIIGAALLAWWVVYGPETEAQVTPLHGVIVLTGYMNILVGVFNLLPGYPLDGGRVLRSAVWGF